MGIIRGTTLTLKDLERRAYAEQRHGDDAATGTAAQCTRHLWAALRFYERLR
jgi:hypothetical protein